MQHSFSRPDRPQVDRRPEQRAPLEKFVQNKRQDDYALGVLNASQQNQQLEFSGRWQRHQFMGLVDCGGVLDPHRPYQLSHSVHRASENPEAAKGSINSRAASASE